jgi:hypothetical protein
MRRFWRERMRWLRRKPELMAITPSLSQVLGPDELMLLFPELGSPELEISFDHASLGPVEEGEKVIGRVYQELPRRLFCLWHFYMRSLAEQRVKAIFGSLLEREMAKESSARFEEQANAMKQLAWLAIRHELNSHWDSSIGVREDWQVVLLQRPQMPEFMRRMFGGQ